jgi:hypothetical protein
MKSHIFLKNAQPKKTKHRNLLFQIDEKELVGGAGFRAQRLVTTTGRDNQLVQMEERRPLNQAGTTTNSKKRENGN